jgi:predicted nucleic acid-binding protein
VIFAAASYLLRALVRPVTPQDQTMAAEAARLLHDAAAGREQFTTSEAIIAEIAFVLTSPRQYNLPVADAAARLQAVLTLRGFRHPRKRLLLRALDVWTTSPNLGFVDALTVAYAERAGVELATFDADFDRVTGIRRYQP